MWWEHINKHTHIVSASGKDFALSLIHTFTYAKTQPKFLTVTWRSWLTFLEIAPEKEGLCQRRRKRGIHEGERRGIEKEEGERGQAGESQQAVSVEVIMRH